MWQMIVEHHIAHTPGGNFFRQPVVVIQKMGLKPQLRQDVSDQSGAHIADRAQHLIGKFHRPQPAFPAGKLGHNTGGDPVRRQFRFSSQQPFVHLFHSATARCQMPLKPVAVHVHNARQNPKAAQIDGSRGRLVCDVSVGNCQRAVFKAICAKNSGAHKLSGQHARLRSRSLHLHSPCGTIRLRPRSGHDQTCLRAETPRFR